MAAQDKLQTVFRTIVVVAVLCSMTEGVALNETCTVNSNCTATVANSRCGGTAANKKCQCDFGYRENGGICIGVPCTTDNVPNSSKNPNQASIRYPDTVIYTCTTGYQLSDGSSFVTRSCGTDGSLSGTTPACSGVPCTTDNVPNSSKEPNQASISYPDTVIYTCAAGYKLSDGSSSVTRSCGTDGSLSGTTPTCSGMPCTTDNVPNSSKNPNQASIRYPDTVIYTCAAGYQLSDGSSFVTRSCGTDGSLSGTTPTCSGVPCTTDNVPNSSKEPNQASISYPDTVIYTCAAGYKLSDGSSFVTRSCGTDGSLSGTTPACSGVPCTTDNVPNSSKEPNQASISYPDTVEYTCAAGYKLSDGSSSVIRSCQTDGSLSGTSPTCYGVPCTTDNVPNSSKNPNQASISYPDTVEYTCAAGYKLSDGSSSVIRSCGTDGSLSGTTPACSGVPCTTDNVPNSSKNPNQASIRYPDTVIYTCAAGYQLSDGSSSVTRSCGTDGSLSGTTPACSVVKCTTPDVNSGTKNPTQSPIDYDTSVTYSCGTGYQLTGTATLRCRADGTLSETAPTCPKISCDASDVDVDHAHKVTSPDTYYHNDQVTYSCDSGYEHTDGNITRTCTAMNTWSGDDPLCTKVTCKAVNVSDAANKHPEKSTYDYNENVTYTCDTGFEHTAGNLTRTCTAIDNWSGNEPTCTMVTCDMVNITNASQDPDQQVYSYNETVTYSCVSGYEHTGGNLTRQCTAIDTWSGAEPECTRITCQPVEEANADRDTAQTSYDYNAQVTYTCNPGYEKTGGDLTRQCIGINTWSGTAPTCSRITCQAEEITNAGRDTTQTSYDYNTQVTYTCNTGYKQTGGDLTRTCTGINTWSGTPPTCSIKTCDRVRISNSAVSPDKPTYNYDEYVGYACTTGYQNTGGSHNRRCEDTNTWSPAEEPVCSRITCSAVEVTNAGKTPSQSTYDYYSLVTYTCNAGFEKTAGDLTRRCTAINTWTGVKPTCTGIACTVSSLQVVAYTTKSPISPSYTYNAEVTYTCVTGYESHTTGSYIARCTAINTWTGNYPTCSIKKCPAVVIENSNRLPVRTEYDYNTAVTYTCKPGYSHTDGDLTRTCQADKSWNGTAPTCAKIKLGDSGCKTVNSTLNSCEDQYALCDKNLKCVCKPEYYDDNRADTRLGTCRQKVLLGNTGCTTSNGVTDSCADGNAVCGSGKCVCTNDYYDDNGESAFGTCLQRINLGFTCLTPISQTNDQCKAENALCSSTTNRCTCITGYHQEGNACVSNKPLGGACNPNITNECSDPNADCLNNGAGSSVTLCTCKPGNYDDNGFIADGNCQDMSQLMVSDITFTNVETSSLRVSWTGPTMYLSHVSSYSVSWSPKGTGSGVMNTDLITASSISGLPTAGAVYTVTITTYNDVTQVDSPRSVSTHKQQATKPSTPGPLVLGNSDLDASDNSISFAWTGSTGEVSGYTVAILDGSTEMKTRTLTGSVSSVVIGFDHMKNGYRYMVKIVANSKIFGGTDMVESDPYNEEIKTDVKPPTTAREFSCKQTTDDSITVEWTAPEYPNGEVLNYKIKVYLKTDLNTPVQTGNLTADSTQYTTTGTLLAGTEYELRIFTSNEEFSPTEYMAVLCKTMDKMSEPPLELTISDITSRSMTVAWKKPIESHGDILGYVLQLRDESDTCHKEIIIKCSNCSDTMNVTSLQNMCPSEVSSSKPASSLVIVEHQQEILSGLVPDYTYIISVAAVNRAGKGKTAAENRTTLEEAPVKPVNVRITEVSSTSFKVIWQKGAVRPGNTSYAIEVKTDSPATSYTHTVYGFDQESYTVTGLEEYWNYSITVTATTSKGSNISDMVSQRTLPAAPGQVDSFTILTGDNGTTYQSVIVRWKIPAPLERNCEITGYTIKYNATTDDLTSNEHNTLLGANEWYSENFTVVPETYYTVEVFARCGDNFTGSKTNVLLQAPAGIPDNKFEKSGKVVIDKDQVTNIGQTTIQITLNLDFFENQNENGLPVEDGIIVYTNQQTLYTDEQSTDITLANFQSMTPWRKRLDHGYWRATRKGFLTEAKSASSRTRRAAGGEVDYTLGVEDCSQFPDDFCNGPLDPNTDYNIRLAVCTNGGCLVSKEYGPFKTKAIPVDPGSNIGGIAGGVSGAVAAVIVVVVIAFIMYRRRRPKAQRVIYFSQTAELDFPRTMYAAEEINTDKCKPLTPTDLHPDIQRKRPVSLEEFPQRLAKLHKDSNLLFSAEYEDLKTLSPSHLTTAADEEDNRLKNRYINILPFDHTRVKLQQKTDDDSDFINANYLPGYKSQREYIGCQGPIPATLDDFWRMVWEQNVGVIVILTLCKEGNKVKCEPYWPEELKDPKQYGDIVVEVVNQSNIKFYDYRIFKISHGNVTKQIKHFHFLSWLDFQANITHDTILDFIAQVRSHVQPPDTAGPMIVHCSAGVGRTGTYICLDYLMQFLEDHDFSAEVDIFDMVLKLRENRPHMVQTEQQYVFIHDCLNEMIERKRRALMEKDNIYVNQGFATDQEESLYQNTENLYQNVAVSGAMALQNTEL